MRYNIDAPAASTIIFGDIVLHKPKSIYLRLKGVIRECPQRGRLGGRACETEGPSMEFRLTFQGELFADSKRDANRRLSRATHKHKIRKKLHPQLRKLWENRSQYQPPGHFMISQTPPGLEHTSEALSKRFSIGNFKFVPLVTRDLDVYCSVEILLLRPDPQLTIVNRESGDVDNRLKTLFDAFSTPRETAQFGGFSTPDANEIPFFTLLEDDSLITKASVETDTLLEPVSDPPSVSDVRAIITVRVWPIRLSVLNLGFA